MPNLDKFVAMRRAGDSTDEILVALHQHGLTIVESITAAMPLFDLGLGDAKALVSAHPAWAPTVEAARPMHEVLSKLALGKSRPERLSVLQRQQSHTRRSRASLDQFGSSRPTDGSENDLKLRVKPPLRFED